MKNVIFEQQILRHENVEQTVHITFQIVLYLHLHRYLHEEAEQGNSHDKLVLEQFM